jgi:hypothetical protein
MIQEVPFDAREPGEAAIDAVMPKIRALYVPDILRVADAIEATDIIIAIAPAGYGKSTIFISGLRDEMVKRGYQPQALDTIGNMLPPEKSEAEAAAKKLPAVERGVVLIDEWPQYMLGGTFAKGGMGVLLEVVVPKGYKIVLLHPDRDQSSSKGNRLHNKMDSIVEATEMPLSVSSVLLEQRILPREIALEYLGACSERSGIRIDPVVLGYMVDVLPRILRVLDQASWWGYKIETKIDFAIEIAGKAGLKRLHCDDCGLSIEEMNDIEGKVKKDLENPDFH